MTAAINGLRKVPQIVWIIGMVIIVPVAVYNAARWVMEPIARNAFMTSCIGGHWSDNDWVRRCNMAYDDLQALKARDWKPTP